MILLCLLACSLVVLWAVYLYELRQERKALEAKLARYEDLIDDYRSYCDVLLNAARDDVRTSPPEGRNGPPEEEAPPS